MSTVIDYTVELEPELVQKCMVENCYNYAENENTPMCNSCFKNDCQNDDCFPDDYEPEYGTDVPGW